MKSPSESCLVGFVDGSAFVERFRLSRAAMDFLENWMDMIVQRWTRGNFALTPRQQLLFTIRYYAMSGEYKLIGVAHGISKASVYRFSNVTRAVILNLFTIKVSLALKPYACRHMALTHAPSLTLFARFWWCHFWWRCRTNFMHCKQQYTLVRHFFRGSHWHDYNTDSHWSYCT